MRYLDLDLMTDWFDPPSEDNTQMDPSNDENRDLIIGAMDISGIDQDEINLQSDDNSHETPIIVSQANSTTPIQIQSANENHPARQNIVYPAILNPSSEGRENPSSSGIGNTSKSRKKNASGRNMTEVATYIYNKNWARKRQRKHRQKEDDDLTPAKWCARDVQFLFVENMQLVEENEQLEERVKELESNIYFLKFAVNNTQ